MTKQSIFDGLDQAFGSEDLQAADMKTLRLATPIVTNERLDKLVAFQRAWLEAVKRHGKDGLAAAQQEALAGAGLPARELGELEAIVRDYCGKRWTMRVLEKRYRELDAKQKQGTLTDVETEKLERLQDEMHKIDPLPGLERRYGHEAVAIIAAREEELIELHQAVGAALR